MTRLSLSIRRRQSFLLMTNAQNLQIHWDICKSENWIFPTQNESKKNLSVLEYAENLLIQWEIKIYICKSHAKWVKPDDWKKYSVLTIMLAASFGQIWSSSDLSVVQVTTVEKSESRELLSASRLPPATALKIFPSVPSFLLW